MASSRSRSRLVSMIVLIVVVACILWFSDQVLAWLRHTIHGR